MHAPHACAFTHLDSLATAERRRSRELHLGTRVCRYEDVIQPKLQGCVGDYLQHGHAQAAVEPLKALLPHNVPRRIRHCAVHFGLALGC